MFGRQRRIRALAHLALFGAVLGAAATGARAAQVTTFQNFYAPGAIVDLAATPAGLVAAMSSGSFGGGSGITGFSYGGAPAWSASLPPLYGGPDVDRVAPAADGTVWFTVDSVDGTLGHVDANHQATLSTLPGARYVGPIASTPDGRVFLVADGQLGLLAADGSALTPIVSPGSIVTDLRSGPDGTMWWVAGRTAGSVSPSGQSTTYALPASASSVSADGRGHAWFGISGAMLRLDIASGTISRFAGPDDDPDLPAAVEHLATATDGSTWFSSGWLDSYGRIDDDGLISVWDLDDELAEINSPTAMAAGADGNLWIGSRTNTGTVDDPFETVLLRVGMKGAPTAASQPEVTVDGTTARIRMQINPQGNETTARVIYGPARPLRGQTAAVPLGSAAALTNFDQTISGLVPGTTYIVLVKATNEDGTWQSHDVRITIDPNATPTRPNVSLPGGVIPVGVGPTTGNTAAASPTLLTPLPARVKLRKGVARLPLRCSGFTCKGTVTVTAKIGGKRGVVLAHRAVDVQPGKTVKLGLRLSRPGLRAVRKAGRKGLGTLVNVYLGGKPKRYRLVIKR